MFLRINLIDINLQIKGIYKNVKKRQINTWELKKRKRRQLEIMISNKHYGFVSLFQCFPTQIKIVLLEFLKDGWKKRTQNKVYQKKLELSKVLIKTYKEY